MVTTHGDRGEKGRIGVKTYVITCKNVKSVLGLTLFDQLENSVFQKMDPF